MARQIMDFDISYDFMYVEYVMRNTIITLVRVYVRIALVLRVC